MSECLTASKLKYYHEEHNPGSQFFTRRTMSFFGDTMANYRVTQEAICGEAYYVLHRRRPVKCGLQDPAYFRASDFSRRPGNPEIWRLCEEGGDQ